LQEARGVAWKEPVIKVFWGDSGVGKSRKVRDMDQNVFNVPVHESGTCWFDGYQDQETILFDDFYGGISYSLMLRFLDGYSMDAQIKGGFVRLNHKQVIITSNKPPEEWYSAKVQGSAEALLRRIYEFGTVTRMVKIGNEIIETDYPRQQVPVPVLVI